MGLRFTLGALVACSLLGCAAAGSHDVGGPATTDEDAADNGEGGTSVANGEAGASVFDAGPPAMIGDGVDSGIADSGGPIPEGGCTSLADCPFQTATNVAGVSCTAGICGITCKGETYDVNGDASDGCEISGACPVGNGTMLCPVDDHTENVAANVGSFSCTDSDSAQNLTGTIPSDARDHAPAIDGFVAATGSTPNYFQIDATGGTFCQDDANFTLTMSAPTKQLACYVLTLITDNNGTGQTCTTGATGTCAITNGSGSYKDNSTIYVEVSKAPTCTATGFPDDGTFAITGHL